MKSNISREIKAFENTEYEIESIFFDIAMEEDTSNQDTTIDDTEKKESFGRVLMDKVNKLIKEITAIIDRLFSKLAGISKRMLVTDTGFKKEARTAMVNNKPLEAIKLITFQYTNNILDTQMDKMTHTILSILKELKSGYVDEKDESNTTPLDMNQKELYAYVLKQMGCPSDITDMNLYYEYIKKQFRGEKKEMLFKSSDSTNYYKIALSYNEVSRKVDEKKLIMKQQVSVLKTNLSSITKNTSTQDSVKKRVLKQSANATHLFNIYSSFISVYTELKIEKTLNYRIILKKLFHF